MQQFKRRQSFPSIPQSVAYRGKDDAQDRDRDQRRSQAKLKAKSATGSRGGVKLVGWCHESRNVLGIPLLFESLLTGVLRRGVRPLNCDEVSIT